MKQPTRNLLISLAAILSVGLLVEGVGLQIPKVLKMLTAVTASGSSSTSAVQTAGPSAASPQMAQPTVAQLQMDRAVYADYAPGEAILITSDGWAPGETVTFTLHEDPQVHADRTWTTVADASGAVFDNQLIADANPVNVRLILTAKGESSGLIVQRLLNLGNTFDQCANGSPVTGVCSWTGGNLNAQNSTLIEGMSTAQRLLITSNLVNGDNPLIMGFSYTQSSKHSYDFFDSWEHASAQAAAFTGFPLDFGNGPGVVNKPSCVQHTGGDVTKCAALTAANGGAGFFADASVPDDPFVSTIFTATSGDGTGSTQARINALESHWGDRTVRLWADQPIVDFHFDQVYGTKHTSDKSFVNVITSDGTDADTYASYRMIINCGACTVVQLQFAAHIGIGQNTPEGWGLNNGATAISGSPYHVITGGDLGSQDNQMQANAIVQQ